MILGGNPGRSAPKNMPKNRFPKKTSFALLAGWLFLAALPVAAYNLEVALPGVASKNISDPGVYIQGLFIFGLSLAGFLAVGAIALGGIVYMAAGTSMTSVEKGKDMIKGALGGLLLLLCSYLILYTIDQTLVDLTPTVPPAKQISKPPSSESAATRNCNPPCGTGFFCRVSDYTCQPIPTNASSENTACLTPGQCTEINCAPAGNCNRNRQSRLPRLVWNPNTCACAQP